MSGIDLIADGGADLGYESIRDVGTASTDLGMKQIRPLYPRLGKGTHSIVKRVFRRQEPASALVILKKQ